jgi:RecA-family ATPase
VSKLTQPLLAHLLYAPSDIAPYRAKLQTIADAFNGDLALQYYLMYVDKLGELPSPTQLSEFSATVAKGSPEQIAEDLEAAKVWAQGGDFSSLALSVDLAWREADAQFVNVAYKLAEQMVKGSLSRITSAWKDKHIGKAVDHWDRTAASQQFLAGYLPKNPFAAKSASEELEPGEYVISQCTDKSDDTPVTTRLLAINGEDIQPEPILWLWPDRFPLGKIIWLGGLPGIGKTMVNLDIAARVTTGSAFPDATNPLGPRRVIITMCEDGLSDTIVPRLMAAGADMKNITFLNRVVSEIEDRSMKLDSDMTHLQNVLEHFPDTALVIMDPMTAYFGDININVDREVRPITTALKKLCEAQKVCFMGVIHNNKQNDANAIQRILGSSSVSGASRAIYGCSADPEDKIKRYFTFIKGNCSAKTSGLEYSVEEKEVKAGIRAPRIVWGKATDDTAEDCIRREREVRYEKKENKQINLAQAFLPFFLKGKGPVFSRDVYAAAEAEGISSRMINAAIDKYFVGKVLRSKTKEGWTMTWVEEEQLIPEEVI